MAINMMCMNTDCKYYWEDCCSRNIQEERIVINCYGECETFEKGVSDWYQEPMAYDYYENPITEGTIVAHHNGYMGYYKAVFKGKNLVLTDYSKEWFKCDDMGEELEDIQLEDIVGDPHFQVVTQTNQETNEEGQDI